jgi:2-dehydro-3-deoxyphosphogluconate aldolase/(4S)-4-hydroxy-2-oxoglutarate aldolase
MSGRGITRKNLFIALILPKKSICSMTKLEIVQRLLDPGIIAIIRADSSEQLVEAAGALLAGGVTAMEVTMTTPNALEVITAVTRHYGNAILMGVGTVIDPQTARAAVAAGAEFIVTPVTKPEVIAVANELGKPIASGALTPTECLLAHESGADFVKLFPADLGGPTYIKNLLAPLPMLRIVPTGGVTPDTAGAFLHAGCVALGAGSSLVSKEILQTHDWTELEQRARAFVRAVKAARR